MDPKKTCPKYTLRRVLEKGTLLFSAKTSYPLLQVVTWIDSPNGGHVTFSAPKRPPMGPNSRGHDLKNLVGNNSRTYLILDL